MKRAMLGLVVVLLVGCAPTKTQPKLDPEGVLRSDAYDPQGRLIESVIQKPDGVSIVESYDPESGVQKAAVLLNPDGSKIVTTHPGGIRKTVHKHLDPLGDLSHSVVIVRSSDGKMLEQQVLDAEGRLREKTVYSRDMASVLEGNIDGSVTYQYTPDGKVNQVINSAQNSRAGG